MVFGGTQSLAEPMQYANTYLCEMQPRTSNDTFESSDMHVTNQQLWLIDSVYNLMLIAASSTTNHNAAFSDTDLNTDMITYKRFLSPDRNRSD